MLISTRLPRGLAALAVLSCLAACGGGGGGSSPDTPPPSPPARTIGGTVTGLSGSGLILQNNGADNLTITGNGAFTFATAIANGSAYAVTASSQPTNPSQTCAVTNGSGTATSNVTSATVTCTTNTFAVRAVVSGLTGTDLTISNGADRVTADADGTFTVSAAVASGASYDVTVDSGPEPAQRCSVTSGSGVIVDANVDIAVACTSTFPTFTYSLNQGDDTLSSYAIDASSGQLRPRFSVKTGDRPATSVTHKPANGKQFNYVLNTNSDNVSAFAVSARTGELSEVGGSPFSTGDKPTLLVLHPTLPFLYATNETGASIAAFSINADSGALATLGTVATGTTPRSFNIETTGRFAYVAAPGSSELYTYAINQSTGALSEVANSRVAIGTSYGGVALERNGRYLYSFNPAAGSISTFALDAATGIPSEVAGSAIAAGADITLLGSHPNGKFIYAKRGPLTETAANGVFVFAIDAASGLLGQIAGSPFDVGANPQRIAFDPSGRRLYASHLLVQGSPEFNVRAYSVDTITGALSVIAGSPFASPQNPVELAIDSTGSYLYASNPPADQLAAYRIDSTDGSLSQLSSSPVSTGDTPTFIAVDEDVTPLQLSSKFVYATDATGNSVRSFTIDSNGLLAAGPVPSNVASAPIGITLDPKGRYAYAASPGANGISIYSVHPTTGTLTEIIGSPFATGNDPQYVAIEATGRYAYVSIPATSTIMKYTIDASTGGISSPVPTVVTGADVQDLLIAPNGRWLLATSITGTQVWSYRIDSATGDLVNGTSLDTLSQTDSLAVDPSGRYAYVTDSAGALLRPYQINSQTGALTPLATSSYAGIGGGAPTGVAVDVKGGFVFTADHATNQVSMFSIQANGTLSHESSIAAGTDPTALTTDYSGNFLCVATGGAGQLLTLRINRDTNTLTLVDTESTGVVSEPGTIVTSSHTE